MKFVASQPVVGMDIAKNVFQLHLVDTETGEIQGHKLKREKVTAFFANRQKSLVAMEACGGAHHWARTLQCFGHEVKLLPAKHVKPFVLRDKTDARDAQAIWVAGQQPHIKSIPVKSEQLQACLALHRLRAQLMKMRIMQPNGLRGLLYEFGIVLPEGHHLLLQRIQGELATAQEQGRLLKLLVDSVQDELRRINGLQNDIDQIERRMATIVKQDQHMQASLNQAANGLPDVKLLRSVAVDTKAVAVNGPIPGIVWLTPRQTGTSGKARQLGISKRGGPHVRNMLMHLARAVITRSTQTSWIQNLLRRRPFSVVVAALVNKLARTAWAVLAKGKAFDQVKWSPNAAVVA